MARLRAEFSAQLMEVVQAASREEIAARRAKDAPQADDAPASAPVVVEKRRPGRPRKNPAPAAAPAKAREITSDTIDVATRFFGERGNKGATATQLASFLAEHGLETEADVIAALTSRGAIRDAGFRRSTGVGNKTSAVFVKA